MLCFGKKFILVYPHHFYASEYSVGKIVHVYLNCKERYEDVIDQRNYAQRSCETKLEKKSGLKGFRAKPGQLGTGHIVSV